MKSDIQQLVRMAAQQGKSPAQLAYEMARHHGHDPARTARAANALTPEKLLRMDPDEFDKAIQTPAGRAILGG